MVGTARLRLLHASGLAFDLSWQASEAAARSRGEALAAWLRAVPSETYSAGAASTTASSLTRSTA